jgi:hypothetical protein
MDETLVYVGGAFLLGGMTGALSGWRVTRRLKRHAVPMISPLSSSDNKWAGEVAEQWVQTHNRPEAQNLIADRLRLLVALRQRRGHPRRRPWS